MREFRYKKIDAFTRGDSLGNPAACLFLEPGQTLSAAEMLFVAKQHKGFVSEVVYCAERAPGRYHLVYYSSECEVDFCGHGTIACMYSLVAEQPGGRAPAELFVETNKKGTLCVYNKLSDQNAVFIAAPAARFIETQLARGEVAEALGLPGSALEGSLPLAVIDAGLRTLIVPIARLSDQINNVPNEAELRRFCERADVETVLTFCLSPKDPGCAAHTRVFPPRFGYLEDPATGSGNSAFGNYMLKNKLWAGGPITIEQGGADRVFNAVLLDTLGGAVLFGGGATTRIAGMYYL